MFLRLLSSCVHASLFAPLAEHAILADDGLFHYSAASKADDALSVGEHKETPGGGAVIHVPEELSLYDKEVRSYVEKFCSPLLSDRPEGGGWEVILDRGTSFKVWRRPVNESLAYEYALRGRSVADANTFIRLAWLDLNSRREWDTSCGHSYSMGWSSTISNVENVYWETVYPWPIRSRDYV